MNFSSSGARFLRLVALAALFCLALPACGLNLERDALLALDPGLAALEPAASPSPSSPPDAGGAGSPQDPDFYRTPAVAGATLRTVRVTPAGAPTLRQALASAAPGDTILLAAGDYALGGGNVV